MYSRGGRGCGGLRGWGRRGVREEEEGEGEGQGAEEGRVGGRCNGSLGGSASDTALLLPSPGRNEQVTLADFQNED